jgi:hypothetical protein
MISGDSAASMCTCCLRWVLLQQQGAQGMTAYDLHTHFQHMLWLQCAETQGDLSY